MCWHENRERGTAAERNKNHFLSKAKKTAHFDFLNIAETLQNRL